MEEGIVPALTVACREAVENQIKDNDPREVKAAFQRLKKQGYGASEAKELIVECMVLELFDVVMCNTEFDYRRYDKNLRALPKPPYDEA